MTHAIRDIDQAASLVGQHLGFSAWRTIGQSTIDAFADVSDDRNWIHVAVEKARGELPAGRTMAHGNLTLSLVAPMSAEILAIRGIRREVSYGYDKVRFITPVTSGARIRLGMTLTAFARVDEGVRLTFHVEMEIAGQARPAMVAETISLFYC